MNGKQGLDLTLHFSTDVAERASRTMRELPRLTKSDASRWMDYWESVGLFEDVEA